MTIPNGLQLGARTLAIVSFMGDWNAFPHVQQWKARNEGKEWANATTPWLAGRFLCGETTTQPSWHCSGETEKRSSSWALDAPTASWIASWMAFGWALCPTCCWNVHLSNLFDTPITWLVQGKLYNSLITSRRQEISLDFSAFSSHFGTCFDCFWFGSVHTYVPSSYRCQCLFV